MDKDMDMEENKVVIIMTIKISKENLKMEKKMDMVQNIIKMKDLLLKGNLKMIKDGMGQGKKIIIMIN